MNPQLAKNFTAGAAIPAYTLVKFSAAETVVPATAATDAIIGVSGSIAAASGERVDIYVDGGAWLVAGAATALGALLTADASGRGVAAAPAAGVNNRTAGFGMDAASAAGDIIRVLLSPGSIQG